MKKYEIKMQLVVDRKPIFRLVHVHVTCKSLVKIGILCLDHALPGSELLYEFLS